MGPERVVPHNVQAERKRHNVQWGTNEKLKCEVFKITDNFIIFIKCWLVCWICGSYIACCSLSQRLSELVGEIFEAASDLQREHMDAWWETAASLAKCSTLPPTARWKTFTSYFMCISLTRGNILLLCWSALIPQRLLTGIICWQGRSFAPLTYRALFFPKND